MKCLLNKVMAKPTAVFGRFRPLEVKMSVFLPIFANQIL